MSCMVMIVHWISGHRCRPSVAERRPVEAGEVAEGQA